MRINMHPFFTRRNQQKGFSLLEVVLYVALFTVLSGVVMNSIFQIMNSFSALRIARDINDSSVKVMERLTRDIKGATSIDQVNSIFNADPGRLTLNVVNASGTATTVEYVVINGALHVKENGVDQGSLMSAKTSIEGLVFRYINTGSTLGIKTELHLQSSRGSVSDDEHFYNTSVMRGTY